MARFNSGVWQFNPRKLLKFGLRRCSRRLSYFSLLNLGTWGKLGAHLWARVAETVPPVHIFLPQFFLSTVYSAVVMTTAAQCINGS